MDKKALHKKSRQAGLSGGILKPEITRKELMQEMALESEARHLRIENDFHVGFDFIKKISKQNSVTVFGSARFKEDHPFYKEAESIGRMLAEEGYLTVTGGAGGIMEAANRGAFEAGGESVGLNITLPDEQSENMYLTDSIGFSYFFSRKVFLAFATNAVIVCPGGFGTMDELFELLTLVQTKKIPEVPIILMGSKFWEDMLKFIKKRLVDEYKTISPDDIDLLKIVDSAEEIRAILNEEMRKDAQNVFAKQ